MDAGESLPPRIHSTDVNDVIDAVLIYACHACTVRVGRKPLEASLAVGLFAIKALQLRIFIAMVYTESLMERGVSLTSRAHISACRLRIVRSIDSSLW